MVLIRFKIYEYRNECLLQSIHTLMIYMMVVGASERDVGRRGVGHERVDGGAQVRLRLLRRLPRARHTHF